MDYSFHSLPYVQAVKVEEVIEGKEGAHHNATLLVYHDLEALKTNSKFSLLSQTIASSSEQDASFDKSLNIFHSSKIITSPTGKLSRDYDDVRRYGDAAGKAIKRAKAAKWTRPLLVLQPPPPPSSSSSPSNQSDYKHFVEVSLLAALAETYEMLQARETSKDALGVIEQIGVCVLDGTPVDEKLIEFVCAVECGRRLARDIGGCDPERMTALKTAETIEKFFANHTNVVVSVMRSKTELSQNYPLLMAVARGSEPVSRHAPCVITLEYKSPNQSAVQEELFLVGKGVTYDTGGMDVKVNGNMIGMSRDKCGAAAMAGFMAVVTALKPEHLNVVCKLAMVRNSIGSSGYVADEILTSRSGCRVRVGNTDAEGRMAMADVLCEMKELALKNQSKARIFTCATLTGHAFYSVGGYPIAMDNGIARSMGMAQSLFKVGHLMGDPFEVSVVRREDFKVLEAKNNAYDVEQIAQATGRATRGHQYPAAFLQIASGIDKHGIDCANEPLSYTHLDIAGAAEDGDSLRPTGVPIVTLATRFIRRLA